MTSTLIRPTAPVERPTPAPVLAYRPALDGLRAVAVLVVIAYHLEVPGFAGGFLGVDLFFVLSGALITALLLLEHERDGRIDWLRFWARRARRLLPAALLLIAVVVPLARADIGIRGDALATLGYVANWRFAAQARSYFAEAAAMSPLNHMWSLAIEEQFYIVWPLLMTALLRVRRWLVPAMAALVVASAVCLAVLFATGDPSLAYYHTFARIHELVVGALAAVALVRTSPRAIAVRDLARRATPAAVVLILASVAALPDASPLYYLGLSLLFSVAVAAVILGLETAEPNVLRRALSWRPLVVVGTLSYGLYLWHWPLVVLLRRAGLAGVGLGAAVVVLTAAAATASAWLVERPVRRGHVGALVLTVRRSLAGAGAAIVALAAAVVVATPASLQPAWADMTAGDPEVIVAAPAAHDVEAGAEDAGAVGARSDGAARAVEAARAERGAEPDGARSAAGANGPADDRAARARPPLTIGVVGDSAAASMLPGIAAAAEQRGDEVISVAARGCPMVPAWQLDETGHSLNYSQECRQHVQSAFSKLVERHDPDLIIWYSGRDTQTRFIIDGEMVEPGEPQHTATVRDGFRRAAEQLTAGGADLVILRSLPRHGNDITDCDRPPAPGDDWCDDVERYVGPTGQNALYEELAHRFPEVTLISEAGLVCGSGPVCDDSMTEFERWRTDLTHFGGRGAERIGEAIITDALVETGRW